MDKRLNVNEQKQISIGEAKQIASPILHSNDLPGNNEREAWEMMIKEVYAKRFDGKFLLQSELHIDHAIFTLLLTKGYLKKHLSLSKSFFNRHLCHRCNNDKRDLFQLTPCIKCKKEHVYCRKCIKLGKIMECNHLYEWVGPAYKWRIIEDPLTWDGKLTDEQIYASNEMIKAIENQSDLLVWAVTGSGKTEMLFPAISKFLQSGKRVCIATPRADVVRELLPRLQTAFAKTSIQGLYGGSRDKNGTAQLIIATTHQLLRFKHAFDLLIIDEVDAFPYHNDQTLQFAAKRSIKRDKSIIYLTATPRKAQQFEMKVNKLPYVFVPLRFHHHLIPKPSLLYCQKLSEIVKQGKIPNELIEWLTTRKNKERQILLFAPTIEYAKEIEGAVAKVLTVDHVINEKQAVSSVTSEDTEREEKIIAYRNKEIYCLITTTILERGVTFPSVDVGVIQANHEVFDEQALVQITGRAGRAKDDPTGEVVFFHNGKTNDMNGAVMMIEKMNKAASQLLTAKDVRQK